VNGKDDSVEQLFVLFIEGAVYEDVIFVARTLFRGIQDYFEPAFIAGAFALRAETLRDILALPSDLAIARATRVTFLITCALDNWEALTVRTGAISSEI
jgi:hypothetical protein